MIDFNTVVLRSKGLGLWYLMPHSTILQLHCGSQLVEETRVADKLDHIMLYRVHIAMSVIQTLNVSGDRH